MKIGNLTRSLLASLFLIVTSGFMAQAADAPSPAKVGYVDLQKAIQSSSKGKKAKDDLDSEFKKRKESLDKKKADIDKMGQDLEKKKSLMSEEALNKKQLELQDEMVKFQKTVAENQTEIQKKEKSLVEPIMEKMRKIVDKVAQDKGFGMVLEKQGQNILYAGKDLDLTDDVTKAFEKEK